MTDEEIIEVISALKANDKTMKDNGISDNLWEKAVECITFLQFENAALRERVKKAVEFPCKIGDRFYIVNDCPPEIKEHECWSFTFTEDGQVLIIDGLDCHYSLKIVYLSKEDAEARLKELKGE